MGYNQLLGDARRVNEIVQAYDDIDNILDLGLTNIFKEPRKYKRCHRLPKPPTRLIDEWTLPDIFRENRRWRRACREARPRYLNSFSNELQQMGPIPEMPYMRRWLLEHFKKEFEMPIGESRSPATSECEYDISTVVEYRAAGAPLKVGEGEEALDKFVYRQHRATGYLYNLVDKVRWGLKTQKEKCDSVKCDEALYYYLKEKALFMKRSELTARFLTLKATRYLDQRMAEMNSKQRFEMVANVVMQAMQHTIIEEHVNEMVTKKPDHFLRAFPPFLDLVRTAIKIVM